jgi:hypothetical protein
MLRELLLELGAKALLAVLADKMPLAFLVLDPGADGLLEEGLGHLVLA